MSRGIKVTPQDAGGAHRTRFLDALYRDYARPLLRFISRQNIGHEEAREIVQESYCRLQQVPQVEAMESARGYLFRTAVNLARDSKRQRRREFHVVSAAEIGAPAEVEVPSGAPTAYQVLKGQQELAIIGQAIEELTPTCRQAFVMHRFGGCHLCADCERARPLGVDDREVREPGARASEDPARRRACRPRWPKERHRDDRAMKTVGDPTQEAADWLARLRSDNMSEMEEARFRAWLSGDPARRREFDALNTMWDELDRVAQLPAVLAAQKGTQGAITQPRVSRRAVVGWALAAGVAGAAGFVSWQRWLASGHYETLVGEQRTVPLADGSIVTLNTSSRVQVRLGASERRITLLQGQAQFEVAKDASRPFVVSVGRGEVRALGTVFDVYRRTGDVVVTLLEGRVSVASDVQGESGSADNRIELASGEQAAFSFDGANLVRRRADVRRVAAWRSRKLDFSDTPLHEAIAEANRYSSIQVELRAPALAQARISGVFDAGRNDAFADALRAYFGLKVQRERDDLLVLTQEKP